MFNIRILLSILLLGYCGISMCQDYLKSEVYLLKQVIEQRLEQYAAILPTLETQIGKKQIQGDLKKLYPNNMLSDVEQLNFLLQPTTFITENQYATARAFFKKIGSGHYKKLDLTISSIAPNRYKLPGAIELASLPAHVRDNLQRRNQKLKKKFKHDKIFTSVLSFEQSITPSLGAKYSRDEVFLIYWLVDSSKRDWVKQLKAKDIRIVGLEPFDGQLSEFTHSFQVSKSQMLSSEERAVVGDIIRNEFLPEYIRLLDSIPQQEKGIDSILARFYISDAVLVDPEIPATYYPDSADLHSWGLSAKAYLELLAKQNWTQHGLIEMEMAESVQDLGDAFVWVARLTLETQHQNDSVAVYNNQLDLNFALSFRRQPSQEGFTDFKIIRIIRRRKNKTKPVVLEKIFLAESKINDETANSASSEIGDQVGHKSDQRTSDSLAFSKVIQKLAQVKCRTLLEHLSSAIRHQTAPLGDLRDLFYAGQDSIEVYNCNRPDDPIRSYPIATYFRNLIKSIPKQYHDLTFFYPQPLETKVYKEQGKWRAEVQFSHYFLGLSKAKQKTYEDFTVKKIDLIIREVDGECRVFLGKIRVVKTDCLRAKKDRA